MSIKCIVLVCLLVVGTARACHFESRWLRGDCGDGSEVGWRTIDVKNELANYWNKDIDRRTSEVNTKATNHVNQEIRKLQETINSNKNNQENRSSQIRAENSVAIAQLRSDINKLVSDIAALTITNAQLQNTVTELKETVERMNRERDEQNRKDINKKINGANTNNTLNEIK